MRQTVVGVYNGYADACSAQRALTEAGIPQADISIYASSPSTPATGGPRVYAPSGTDVRRERPVFDQLEQLFSRLFERGEYPPETEDYREVIRRGGAIVSVDISEVQTDLACDVMRRTGAADIEERAKAWRERSDEASARARDGLTGREQPADAASNGPSTFTGESPARPGTGTPSSEPLASAGSASESARELGAGYAGDPGMEELGDDGSYEDEFRRDYDSRYANTNAPYDDYHRAYTHGASFANDERFRGREWPEVEAHAREHWESRYPESAWERFKAAVRHGWERVIERR